MKKFLVLVIAAVVSIGATRGQVDESKKEYFHALDSVLSLTETDPVAALELCKQIQEKWGISSDLMYCKGASYVYMQNYEAASMEFALGASSWKKDDYFRIGAYYRALAAILQDIGDYDNAIKQINKGIKADKKYYNLYYMRGECYQNMANYKKAIPDFKKACLDENLFCDAKAEIALCHASLGNIPSAKKVLEESLARDTYHAESRRMRAMIALTEARFEDFIDDYLLFMQINKPTSPSYIFELCEEKKYHDYAMHYAAEILEGQSDSLGKAYWEWVVGAIEINSGNETEMWKHTQRAKTLNPGIEMLDTKILYQYATHYNATDNLDSLLVVLDTLIARDARNKDDNYALLTAKGRVLQKQKKFSEAVAAYENALRMGIFEDDKKTTYFRIANICQYELLDADKALAYYDSLLAIDKSLTAIIYQVGKINLDMKHDTVKANKNFESIIELEKDMQLSSNSYSQFALAQMGRFAEAEAFQKRLDEYANTAKEKSGMAYNAACLYSLIGKTDIAIEKLMEAMDAGELSCQQMKDDKDFNNIRENESYKAIEKMICLAEEE